MIKQFISFKSPSGNPVSKTLYFDLNEFEVTHDMELEVLQERLQRFQDEVIGEDKTLIRDLTTPEKREMLDIVKILIRHSYGERRNDDEFWKEEQDPDIWKSFVASGAFNAFVLYLFEDPERANHFMAKIWPKVVQDNYEKSLRGDLSAVPDLEDTPTNVGREAPVYPDDDGIQSLDAPSESEESEKKVWSDYTPEELLEMNTKDFEILYAESRQGKNIPAMLLNIRQRRKMSEGAEEPGGATE